MFMAVRLYIRCLVRNERGATMIEYTLLAGLISVVVVAILLQLKTPLENIWGFIRDEIIKAQPATPAG